ncbi:Beta-glucosidase 11 [Vitis vinifera]|uniref:Beta-glucosidase 11 n=1 Tax=Vitis vinifera TaxID=29760 RepID=A0A438F3C9_VITVI|nr:Beta-glucosidase 11 [Vitis vinifera]
MPMYFLQEDVELMVETGLEAYRFSISWSRLIPNGRGPVNPKGLAYYNNFINELISHGIQPHVTLFHSDLPQALEDEYEGWISRRIVVLYWSTLNEGNIFALGGYDTGMTPPHRCSPPFGNCPKGNSSTEAYIAAHHILLAHASVVQLYREKYQETQQGFIGINVFAYWFVPMTNETEDIIATQRAHDFFLGCTLYIKNSPKKLNMDHRDFLADMAADIMSKRDDTQPDQFPVMPWGLQEVLEYFKQVYGNPPVYIHENGQRTQRNTSLNDTGRVKYLQGYIGALLNAVRNGSNAKGYFIWSFLDVLELLDGYESSYGLYYVDLDDPDLKRYPKLSAHCQPDQGGDGRYQPASGTWCWCICNQATCLTQEVHWCEDKEKNTRCVSMAKNKLCFFSLFLVLNLAVTAFSSLKFSRDDFPLDFIFGSGTSAYQVYLLFHFEQHSKMGGPLVSGIPLLMLGNIYPIAISDEQGFLFIGLVIEFSSRRQSHGATGDITSDQYHKYKITTEMTVRRGGCCRRTFLMTFLHTPYMSQMPVNLFVVSSMCMYFLQDDVKLMVETGLEAYRFSISWSRLIPNGRGPVNPKGLAYYNNLINELLSHGIQPHVTLFHSDTPQALEDEYEGWISRRIVYGSHLSWSNFTFYAWATSPPPRTK